MYGRPVALPTPAGPGEKVGKRLHLGGARQARVLAGSPRQGRGPQAAGARADIPPPSRGTSFLVASGRVRLNRWLNRARRWLGYGYCNLSASLTAMLQSAARFVTAFETAVVHEAARRRVGGVVCGHIHPPGPRAGRPILYCNSGGRG